MYTFYSRKSVHMSYYLIWSEKLISLICIFNWSQDNSSTKRSSHAFK